VAKPADPAEIKSFALFEDEPDVTVLDRSTLQNWTTCPWQAKAIEGGRVLVTSNAMASGEEGHAALSRATQFWIDSNGLMSPTDIRNCLESELRAARPDVQPEALAGVMASAWSWAQYLHAVHPDNILRFDGGEVCDRSGQLSIDLEGLDVRVTSELDLLHAGDSIELLHEVDYKTGHQCHSASDVAHAFQFQLHAVLVFENYPHVNGLEVVAWDTRLNRRSYRVVFDRRRVHDYRSRLRMAVETRMRHFDSPPTWPTVEKCELCPAAAICPEPGEPIRDIAQSPPAVLKQLIATEAKGDALRKLLTAYVDQNGRDVTVDGHAFGRVKATERKPTAKVYKLATEDTE
jgi:hypothetical protein